MLLKILFLLVLTNLIFAIPPNDKALFEEDPESRISKKRRPCRGRSLPEGRTFFDWSFQYVDVNYNYNYNINCGGGGGHGGGGNGGGYGGGGPQKPILSGVLQSIGNRPTGGGHPPTGGLLGDHYNRPGQYLVAQNPIFGNFVYDLADINPNRIYRQFNKELNRLVRPWAHLLGR